MPLNVLDSSEVNKHWSSIPLANDYIGCFEPTSGVLKCEEYIEAYRELAELHEA